MTIQIYYMRFFVICLEYYRLLISEIKFRGVLTCHHHFKISVCFCWLPTRKGVVDSASLVNIELSFVDLSFYA